MTDDLFHTAFSYLLHNEGGESNHPKDHGGHTVYGISAPVARKYGYTPGQITLTEARDIYYEHYWRKWDWVSDGRLRIKLFDAGVVMGNPRATLLLQKALSELGFNPGPFDGLPGKRTKTSLLEALATAGPDEVMIQFKIQMEGYFRRLVLRKPDQDVFLRGWVNRARREPGMED